MGFKQTIGLGQFESVGLDIGSSSVKMVKLRKENGRYIVVSAVMACVCDGENQQQDVFTGKIRAVEQCFRQGHVKGCYAVSGICGSEVMVGGFVFPYLPQDCVHQAVTIEAQQVCPLDFSLSSMDYQVIEANAGQADGQAGGTNPGRTSGIFVVASNNAIQHKAMIMANASVKNAIMDVDGIALLNCLQACQTLPQDKSTAVVDVGNSVTNVSILGCDGMPFVRDLPHAGRGIVQQIATELNIPTEAVEKTIQGDSNTGVSQQDVTASLCGACQTLITEIAETLRYYTLQEGAAPVDRVYLCGGFAMVHDFVGMLEESLSEEVVVFNPFSKMEQDDGIDDPQLLEDYGPAMVLAAGLAMRTV